jgi:hypothetical protein
MYLINFKFVMQKLSFYRYQSFLLFSLLVLLASFSLSAQTQIGADIDGEAASDNSGNSVSISSDGSRVAIGARRNDEGGTNSGHVRIYDYNGTAWVQVGADIDGEAANDLSGYSVSISSDGSRVAIGAYGNDGAQYSNKTNSGHVRIYEYSSGSWNQLGADIDGEAAGDNSGYSVSLSSDGSRVAIGAPRHNGNVSGNVRIFKYDLQYDRWLRIGNIDGEAANDGSGYSVSLSSDGSRVAIGASGNDANGTNSGHVRVYEYSSGSVWGQVGADIDGEAAGDNSGYSVSISSDGSRVAIGAHGNDGKVITPVMSVFMITIGRSWTKLEQILMEKQESMYSGYSVSISSDGSRVAIGASTNDGNGATPVMSVFMITSGSWTQVGADIDGEAANDRSGSLSLLSSDGIKGSYWSKKMMEMELTTVM